MFYPDCVIYAGQSASHLTQIACSNVVDFVWGILHYWCCESVRSCTWPSVTGMLLVNILSHLSCFIMNGICV